MTATFQAPPPPPPRASSSTVENIDNVDAFARKLYRRARSAGPDFEEIAAVVRGLHTVLKHLKVEAEDPESLLNADGSNSTSVYVRQLTPIIEDSDFALKQLDTILGRYYARGAAINGNASVGSDGESGVGKAINDGDKGWVLLESRERDMIELIRTKLANQKLNIDMFLDTVQLHNPAKSRQMVDTTSANLDSIKDKVDAIASRLLQRKDSNLVSENEDELWEQFRDALEADGFSRDVLRKNQDVLRAYIRQLDEQFMAQGGRTPSVRGFLESYHPAEESGLQVAPYPAYMYSQPAELDSKEIYNPSVENETFFPSKHMERLHHDEYPPAPSALRQSHTGLSYEHHSSDDENDPATDAMALISTRDLMALDKRSADLAIAMDRVHLHQQPPSAYANNYTISGSPSVRYVPPSSSQPALLSSSPTTYPYDHTEGDAVIDQYAYDHASPRFVPSLPPPPLGKSDGRRSPQPTLRSNSISAPSVIGEVQALPPPVLPPPTSSSLPQQQQQRCARLLPDSQGRDIPLEAKWTRIRRSLVSPVVLAQAGVRYEARPDFVAVLGALTREEIAEYARRSAEIRSGRRQSFLGAPASMAATPNNSVGALPGVREEYEGHDKDESLKRSLSRKDRKTEDRYHPDKYRNWDVIEGQQEGKGPGYVVDARDERQRRPRRGGRTDSSVSDLYDSSDEEALDEGNDDREPFPAYPGSIRNSYPPSAANPVLQRAHSSSQPYHHNFSSSPGNNPNRMRTDSGLADISSNSSFASGSASDDGVEQKGTKVYPYIVPAPKEGAENARMNGAASPAATVKPKPILKNRGDDPHVRFNPEPQVLDESVGSLPRSSSRRDRDRDRDRERERERDPRERGESLSHRHRDRGDSIRDRERESHRDREKRYRSDRYLDREQERERYPERNNSDRYREHRHHGGGGGGGCGSRYASVNPSSRRGEREREDYSAPTSGNSSSRRKDERATRKRTRGDTLRAVGIGGAAASLLSVLTEAAAGL
ncbi:Uu.00g079000.m01.CDS01 [Anthostomella pinea]|uniref:Uu.00g079000.m01.CDS01 n=1 Tax=Anthostomella pinea TaxID=933095 RepID=A0AAI8VKN9_9PEZI|nr:Uu.00g079000.m01.CDS01 [Anthostomella pinea]